jgi:hypothetical protein
MRMNISGAKTARFSGFLCFPSAQVGFFGRVCSGAKVSVQELAGAGREG